MARNLPEAPIYHLRLGNHAWSKRYDERGYYSVDVRSGTIILTAGGSSNGTMTGAGNVAAGGGLLTISGSYSVTGTTLSGGELRFASNVSLANLTWIRGRHSLKGGAYFEQSRNSEGKGGVGAGPWAGQFTFSTDANNPFDTNHSYANALIGSFANYTEIDAFADVRGRRNIAEFYAQDTWKASRRLTVDYGVRFLWYTPWYSSQPAAVFVPDRYDPAKAPRLYQPAVVNGANVALDPVKVEKKLGEAALAGAPVAV